MYREQDLWFLRCPEIQILGFIILMFYLANRFNGPDPYKVDLLGAGFYFSERRRG